MRLTASKTGFLVLAASLFAGASGIIPVAAQTLPETLRINVDPPEPGVRSVTLDRKYHPVINRDSAGVVIDILGTGKTPPCEVELEVTLENSRVLRRQADICTGGGVLVRVEDDGKPGQARVIQLDPSQEPSQSAGGRKVRNTVTPVTPEAPETTLTTPDTPSSDVPLGDETAVDPLAGTETGVTPDSPQPDGAEDAGLPALVTKTLDDRGLTETTGPVAGPAVPAPSEDRVWSVSPPVAGLDQARLIHTVPETDDEDFQAICRPRSGQAVISFYGTGPAIYEGAAVPVELSAGDYYGAFIATGSGTNNQYGQSFPLVTVPLADPVWTALARQSEMLVKLDGVGPYTISLKGSAKAVKHFTAVCAQPQQIVEDGAAGSGGARGGTPADAACSEFGIVRSRQGAQAGRIVFRNSDQQPVDVHWIDYDGGKRHYARLLPGQVLDQQTFVSHAWLVTAASGQCLGIFVSKSQFREVTVGGGRAAAPLPPGNLGLPTGPVPPANVGGGAASAAAAGGASYLCTAGVDLQVTFDDASQTATIVEFGQRPVTLARVASGSGFAYESPGYSFKGQVRNATYTRPGLYDVFCAQR